MAQVTNPFERAKLLGVLVEEAFSIDHSRVGARLAELTAFADRVGAPWLLAEAAWYRGRYLMWIREPPDPEGALRAYEEGLDIARSVGDQWHENSHLVGLAYAHTALGSSRAPAACHDVLTRLCASRDWGLLSILLVGVTSWFAANGNPTAAAVTAGYVQRSDVYWWDVERRLEELGLDRDPNAASSMARGRAMDAEAIVAYVLREFEAP
jgi:hypothetical protein